MFDPPIKTIQFRKNQFAEKYANGVINICGKKYLCYSLTEAIKEFRNQNPMRTK
jgi:hypothetical protein